MPATASNAPMCSEAKRAALTDEIFDSSSSLLRPSRGSVTTRRRAPAVLLAPRSTACPLSTFDLTAGGGSLLAGVDREIRSASRSDADQVAAGPSYEHWELVNHDGGSAMPTHPDAETASGLRSVLRSTAG